MFDVSSLRIRQRQHEAIVALNGTGWPAQAKRSQKNHTDYAKKTLYAYMPCSDTSGTESIDELVRSRFGSSYPRAVWKFVTDKNNLWCPPWIRRNYELKNKAIEPDKEHRNPAAPDTGDVSEPLPRQQRFPHATKKDKYVFETTQSGEPQFEDEDPAQLEHLEADHHWKPENRPLGRNTVNSVQT
jgi:hypothetical protein